MRWPAAPDRRWGRRGPEVCAGGKARRPMGTRKHARPTGGSGTLRAKGWPAAEAGALLAFGSPGHFPGAHLWRGALLPESRGELRRAEGPHPDQDLADGLLGVIVPDQRVG